MTHLRDRIGLVCDLWRARQQQGGIRLSELPFIWLCLKCTICIALGLEGRALYCGFNCVPLAAGPWGCHQTWDGPTADWWEIGVDGRWWCWRFYNYTNGI